MRRRRSLEDDDPKGKAFSRGRRSGLKQALELLDQVVKDRA
jgi:hypothetical protein